LRRFEIVYINLCDRCQVVLQDNRFKYRSLVDVG